MTYPIQNGGANPTRVGNEGAYETPDYAEFEWADEDTENVDEFQNAESAPESAPLGVNELRARLGEMKVQLAAGDFGAAGRETLRGEIEALEIQVNQVGGLPPAARTGKLAELSAQLGGVEASLYGGWTEDAAAEGASENENDPEGQKALESKKDELNKRIDKYYGKGWITEELRDKLKAELTKADAFLADGDLLAVADEVISGLETTLGNILALYTENQETVDQVDGIAAEKVTKETLPSGLAKLVDLIPSIRDKPEAFLEKLQSAYPELDADHDGELSAKELDDGVKEEIFPPRRPNDQFIKFLTGLDPELKDKWEATTRSFTPQTGVSNDPYYQYPDYAKQMHETSLRLKDLLGALYGEGRVTVAAQTGHYGLANNLTFDGQTFEAFREDVSTRDIKVQWY